MSHDELSDLLQSLPHAEASRDFTARTLERVARGRRASPSLKAAFAIVMSAILLLSGVIGIRHHQHELRVQQLRSEQQQIRNELEQLKAISDQREPHVFVAGSGSVDFVIGLDKRKPPSGKSQPVSLRIEDDGTY